MKKGRQHDNDEEVKQPKVTSVPDAGEKQVVLARDVLPETLPIIPISNRPLFPKMIVPMVVDDEKSRKAIAEVADSSSKFVGVVLSKQREDESKSAPVKASHL